MAERIVLGIFIGVGVLIIACPIVFLVIDRTIPAARVTAFSVTGTAEWVVEVDSAKWKVRCMVFAPNKATLKEEAVRAQEYVLTFLKSNGFEEGEIVASQSGDAVTNTANKSPNEVEAVQEKVSSTHLDILLTTRNLVQMEVLKTKLGDFYTKAKKERIWINMDKPEYSFSEMDSLTKVLLQEAINNAQLAALNMKRDTLSNRPGKLLKQSYDHTPDNNADTLAGRIGQRVKCTVVMEFHIK